MCEELAHTTTIRLKIAGGDVMHSTAQQLCEKHKKNLTFVFRRDTCRSLTNSLTLFDRKDR